jgi:putative membrane protein
VADGGEAQRRRWWSFLAVGTEGQTPDYRFSLANERTFLAWIRTALGLVGGGLAVDQLLPDYGAPTVRHVLATGLMLFGAITAVRAVVHWTRCERAIRTGRDLPPSRYPALLAAGLAVGAMVLALMIVTGASS